MKKSFLLFALAALALTACQEEIAPEDNHETPTVDQTTDSAEPQVKDYPLELNFVTPNMVDAKTTLVDGSKVNWIADDMIKVFWAEGKSNPAKAVLSDDASKATFSTQVEEADAYYAVYPYTDKENLSGDVITVEVPSVQGGTFADANIMLAKADANNQLPFKHLVGLLEFEVDMAGTVQISGASDDVLAGNVKISGFAEDGTPEYSVENGAKTVSIEVKQAGTYYAALLPSAKLNCVSIKVTTADGESQNTEYALSANSIQLSRGALIPLGNVTSCLGKHFFVKADADGSGDGKTWETAFTYQQVADLVAANRSVVSGVNGTNTDIAGTGFTPTGMTADAYRQLHNTEHAAQVNGVTFHFAAGTYSSAAYVRISYPERGEAVKISFKGGYPATSKGTDLNNRDSETNITTIDGQSKRRLFFPRYYVDLAFDGITFANGKVNTGGGAFLFNESQTSSLTFRNCKFTNNVTTNNGSTKYSGGAILAKNGSGKISLDNCDFTGNSSQDVGGAINIEGNGELTITGGIFKDNSAGSNAGAINVNCNVFSADGVTFENNTCAPTAAGNAQGGAIYFATNANYKERTLTNCIFTGNSTSAKYAVWQDAVEADPDAGTEAVTEVHNYVRGGAIYVAGLPKVTINGGSFTGNSQKDYSTYKLYGGGAIFSVSEIALSGVTLTENSAYYGGAIFSSSKIVLSDVTFSKNSANFGGAFDFIGETTVSKCKFIENTSTTYGGALYTTSKTAVAVFTNCEINKNSSANNGGAIFVNPAKKITFTDCAISGNSVTGTNVGGALYVSNGTTLIFTRGSFTDNIARSRGGAIYSSGAETVEINGTVFSGNKAKGEHTSDNGDGGAIRYSNANANWTLTNVSFTENSAADFGGAIYANGGTLTLNGGSFSKNSSEATGAGGGAIYVTGGAKISVDGTSFTSNTTASSGGAVRISNSAGATQTFDNATFTGNSGTDGGAIDFRGKDANVKLNVTGCTFTSNSATTKNGGAIYTLTGKTIIKGSTFSGNTCGGGAGGGAIYVTTNSGLSVEDSRFESNIASVKNGGAINVANTVSTNLSIKGSTFTSNSTTAASTEGGAIYYAGTGSLAIDNSSFTSNSAVGNSGAIAANGTGTIKVNASTFDGNIAKYGAASRVTSGPMYINGCTFTRNKPTNKYTGGVLYAVKPLYMNNCVMYDNDNTGSSNVSDLVINGVRTVVTNTTFLEKDSNMTTVLGYNQSSTAPALLYNNVILGGENSVCAGYLANPGSIVSQGYNYSGEWTIKVNDGVTGTATMAETDNKVTPSSEFDKFTGYIWTIPDGKNQTTLSDMTAFLNGVEGGTAFVEWLGGVNGLSHDIAGNARPTAGAIYPGCYQKN